MVWLYLTYDQANLVSNEEEYEALIRSIFRNGILVELSPTPSEVFEAIHIVCREVSGTAHVYGLVVGWVGECNPLSTSVSLADALARLVRLPRGVYVSVEPPLVHWSADDGSMTVTGQDEPSLVVVVAKDEQARAVLMRESDAIEALFRALSRHR